MYKIEAELLKWDLTPFDNLSSVGCCALEMKLQIRYRHCPVDIHREVQRK